MYLPDQPERLSGLLSVRGHQLSVVLNKPVSPHHGTPRPELDHLLREIVYLSPVDSPDYAWGRVGAESVREGDDGLGVEGVGVLLGVDEVLEHDVQRGLWVIVVEVAQKEVSVVNDGRHDQVERVERGLREAGVEQSLHNCVVIKHVREPGQEPGQREGRDVT